MNYVNPKQQYIQESFDAFCKKVLKNNARDYLNKNSDHIKRKNLSSNLSYDEIKLFCILGILVINMHLLFSSKRS